MSHHTVTVTQRDAHHVPAASFRIKTDVILCKQLSERLRKSWNISLRERGSKKQLPTKTKQWTVSLSQQYSNLTGPILLHVCHRVYSTGWQYTWLNTCKRGRPGCGAKTNPCLRHSLKTSSLYVLSPSSWLFRGPFLLNSWSTQFEQQGQTCRTLHSLPLDPTPTTQSGVFLLIMVSTVACTIIVAV